MSYSTIGGKTEKVKVKRSYQLPFINIKELTSMTFGSHRENASYKRETSAIGFSTFLSDIKFKLNPVAMKYQKMHYFLNAFY